MRKNKIQPAAEAYFTRLSPAGINNLAAFTCHDKGISGPLQKPGLRQPCGALRTFDVKPAAATRLSIALLCLLGMLPFTAWGAAGEAPPAEKPAPPLSALLAACCPGDEPLLLLATPDLGALPAQLAQTSLWKMIDDPGYAKGAALLRRLVARGAGADFKDLWPRLAPLLAGPAVLTLNEARLDTPATGGDGFRLVLSILTHDDKEARTLRELWPKQAPQSDTLLSIIRLNAIGMEQLQADTRAPLWIARHDWSQSHIYIHARPAAFGAVFQTWWKKQDGDTLEPWLDALNESSLSHIKHLRLNLSVVGDNFSEDLHIDLNDGDSTRLRVAKAVKEKPAAWETLTSALPPEQDILLMGQADLEPLRAELPAAAQALERMLRGRKWSRGRGKNEEALSKDRFQFILEKLQGSFALCARPALSGDLRFTVATVTKEKDAEALRDTLLKGLAAVDAPFETLPNKPRIGAAAPLGATFKGNSLFGAPIIGLSPGWLWLCSNSGTYQELIGAFKSGKSLAAEQRAELAALKNNGKSDPWRSGDALRLQLNLERIIKLAYSVWLLSGDEGPFIAGWKVPADILPPPIIFNGRLGVLHAGLSRDGLTLNAYAQSAFPLASLALANLLDKMAQSICDSKTFAAEAAENENDDPARATETAPRAAHPPHSPGNTGDQP
jgi:hypothetical protein